jgi:hypothetical protein
MCLGISSIVSPQSADSALPRFLIKVLFTLTDNAKILLTIVESVAVDVIHRFCLAFAGIQGAIHDEVVEEELLFLSINVNTGRNVI